jgi:hypothetical protein
MDRYWKSRGEVRLLVSFLLKNVKRPFNFLTIRP